MATKQPTRGGRTATHKAKAAMGELMHQRVAKTVQMKEQRNKGAKKN